MFEWVARQVAETGLLGVFVLMVAENIFPPIPSEIIMAASGFAAARGEISLIGTIIVAVLGTVVGNAFWYEIGRWFGLERIRPFVARYGKWFAIETEDMDRAERTLKRWGPFALCFGRMLPGIRTIISIPAGMVLIPRGVFYFWTAIGSAIWLSFLAISGYMLEEHYDKVQGWVEPLAWVVVGGSIAAYGLHLVYAFRRARRRQGQA